MNKFSFFIFGCFVWAETPTTTSEWNNDQDNDGVLQYVLWGPAVEDSETFADDQTDNSEEMLHTVTAMNIPAAA